MNYSNSSALYAQRPAAHSGIHAINQQQSPTSLHLSASSQNSLNDSASTNNSASTFFVQALYAYSGVDTSSLSFNQGDVIEVLSTLPSGWWDGVICDIGHRGWFPSNYCQKISDEEAVWARNLAIERASAQNSNQEYDDSISYDMSRDSSSQSQQSSSTEAKNFVGGILKDFSSIGLNDPKMINSTSTGLEEFLQQEDLNLFSSGGDIFSEIAAAAQADSGAEFSSSSRGRISHVNSYPISVGHSSDQHSIVHSHNPQQDEEEDFWIPRVTNAGKLFYYNSKTGETSLDMPIDGRGDGIQIDTSEFILDESTSHPQNSTANEERSVSTNHLNGQSGAARNSLGDASMISGLTAQANDSTTPAAQPDERDSTNFQPTHILTSQLLSNEMPEPMRPRMNRLGSSAGLLEISLAPLLSELESSATDSLNLLAKITQAQISTQQQTGKISAQERNELAQAGNQVNLTIHELLRCSGTLDSTSPSHSTNSSAVQTHLRQFVRRVTTPLTKLNLSVRASWGLLETIPSDQTDEFIDEIASSDAEEFARRQLVRDSTLRRWENNNQIRHQLEIQSRQEILAGIEKIRSSLEIFLGEYERVHKPIQENSGQSNEPLRMMKPLQGSLRTSAAALLAGNASGAHENSLHRRNQSTEKISAETAASLTEEVETVQDLVHAMKFQVEQVEQNSNSSRTNFSPLFEKAGELQNGLNSILSTLEKLDVSSEIDLNSAESEENLTEAAAVLADRQSNKSKLYEDAANLMISVQQLVMTSAQPNSAFTSIRPQPKTNSALDDFKLPSSDNNNAIKSVLTRLSELSSHLSNLYTATNALAKIAETQSSAAGATESNLTEASSEARDSQDSDFFFSGIGASTLPDFGTASTRRSTQTESSGKEILSPISGNLGWNEQRRGSTATGHTSLDSNNTLYKQSGVVAPVRSESARKLARLRGEDIPPSVPVLSQPLPSWLGSDFTAEDISFNMEGQIRGGTLKNLVIAATSHEGRVDSSYLQAFLMTYRTFCDCHELLDLLIDRFFIAVPENLEIQELKIWETQKLRPIRARVANFIKSWVREFLEPEEINDTNFLHRVQEFATSRMEDSAQSHQIGKIVSDLLQGISPRQTMNLNQSQNFAIPNSIVPRSFKKLKFTEIDALELARQLTLIDSKLFMKITAGECLGKAWPKQFGLDAPNITTMIEMSNAVTRWVIETILAQEDLKKRANVVKHFILLAEKCLSLNNFSTLIHIIAGLNSTPIHRLRRTWETVNQKSMTSLTQLNKLMRPDKNYKNYRQQLRQVAPPCVPFLGVYLTDWTFIGDGNPDMLREKPHQINFNKRQKASELILMIQLHQSTAYNLAQVPVLTKFLNENLFPADLNPQTDDQRLYEISLSREPRERDDEKITRLLSESGFL